MTNLLGKCEVDNSKYFNFCKKYLKKKEQHLEILGICFFRIKRIKQTICKKYYEN